MDAITINRVSDPHQIEGYSLEEQALQSIKYATHKGFNIVKEFSFQETASRVNHRKKFDEIIKFIKNYSKNPLVVIAEKHDRLYRNHINKAQLQLFLQNGKIEIHLYKENKQLTKDSSPSDFLINDVMTSVNEYQSRNTSRECKKGMISKARGGWLPHKPPLGYLNVSLEERTDKNKRRSIIQAHPWGKPLIQRMYQLKAEGNSYRLVRQMILDEGLLPDGYRSTFYPSKVEKIIKNPFYKGEFDWAGERFIGKHEPLVSQALWNKAQEGLYPMRQMRKKHGALSGFLKCDCGCLVTYDPKDKPSGKHYDYYRCANGKGKHRKLTYVTENDIFDQFKGAMKNISISEKKVKQIVDRLNEVEVKARQVSQRNIEEIKLRLKEMESAEDRLYDDLKKGTLDEQGYKRQLARVRSERQRYMDILCKAQDEITGVVLETAKNILELAQMMPELYLRRTPQEKRELLEKILSNPVLDGVSVRYELKRPFSLIAKMASSSKWGG